MSKRLRLIWTIIGLMALVITVSWLRLRGPNRNASAFATAINVGAFGQITTLMGPEASLFPDEWANPANWGDDGALFADAFVTPLTLSDVLKAQRIVVATVHLDAEPRNGIRTSIYPHSFVVTADSIQRIPKKPDNVLYPVTIRPFQEAPTWDTPKDVTDVPTAVIRVGGDEKKLYCLIGDIRESSVPKKLLVVMPGGDGSSNFSPFIRRLYKHALDDNWMVAQIVAPRWSRTQKIVWPLRSDDDPEVEFGSDELFDVVVDDIASRVPVDQEHIYLLAWSSSGPVAYRIALRDEPKLAGAFIAMSVFKEEGLSRSTSGSCPAIYLLQSPDDRITRFQHAETAREYLTSLGRRVALTEYAGGHGWHGNPYQMVSQGVAWLTSQCSNEPGSR